MMIGSWKQVCNEKTNQHIIIWTDCFSSLMAFRSINIRSKTVADSLTTIRNIATANMVELRWIAAHTGLWGSERADELAPQLSKARQHPDLPLPTVWHSILNQLPQRPRKPGPVVGYLIQPMHLSSSITG